MEAKNKLFVFLENRVSPLESGGREGIRTLGLLVANEALSQLSYSPTSSNEFSLAEDAVVSNARWLHGLHVEAGGHERLHRMDVKALA